MVILDSITGLYYEVQVEDGQLKLVETTAPATTVSLVVGTNTWVTLAEAEDYFAGRLGASTFWTVTADKTAALVTAYNYLNNAGLFDFPDTAVQVMKDAQCETALFLLQHMADMDARKGIQAQGVTRSDIVGETYKEGMIDAIALPAYIKGMLSGYDATTNFYATDVTRDDDEDV